MLYFGVKPWEVGRLKVAEFELLCSAADELHTHDTRFVKEE